MVTSEAKSPLISRGQGLLLAETVPWPHRKWLQHIQPVTGKLGVVQEPLRSVAKGLFEVVFVMVRCPLPDADDGLSVPVSPCPERKQSVEMSSPFPAQSHRRFLRLPFPWGRISADNRLWAGSNAAPRSGRQA